VAPGSNRYKLELGRAERLFGAKRYTQARQVFEGLRSMAQGDERELVNLRIAESDYFLKRARNARDGVKPYVENASRQGEALFFYAVASRDLGDTEEYLRTVRRLAQDFGDQTWAEEALNNLATYYIVQNDDAQADATFREMYEKFPTGRYAERAAWKLGWWAYKNGQYADTVRAFESGASNFPRSDYRPSWLYWSARAHESLGNATLAESRYNLVATDYLNTYYGRLAMKHLDPSTGRGGRATIRPAGPSTAFGASEIVADESAPAALPPNAPVVRALLAAELYDQALDELKFAQRNWGDSPAIQATFGWIYNQRGDLRAGINAIKRAYPQYMAAGGERLPPAILKVLFPVSYWPLIRKYSAANNLDPFMIAALIAQESTFTADVRSSANAYGLMQILPSTGRQYNRSMQLSKAVLDLDAHDGRNQHQDGDQILLRPGAPVRRRPLRARHLQRGSESRRPLDFGAAGRRPRRVHRRHPVPRNPGLREENPGDRRGLSTAVRRRLDGVRGSRCRASRGARGEAGAGGEGERREARREVEREKPAAKKRQRRRRSRKRAPRAQRKPPESITTEVTGTNRGHGNAGPAEAGRHVLSKAVTTVFG
jgi:soluble lytic murein transglycosylase-like protein